MSRLVTMGRRDAERSSYPWPCAVISIYTPGDHVPNIAKAWRVGWHTEHDVVPNIRDVLYLAFGDTDPESPAWKGKTPLGSSRAMEPWQARAALDFARRWAPDVEVLVVHCDAGLSRSVGVAAGIAASLGLDFDRTGNAWCKALVMRAARGQA